MNIIKKRPFSSEGSDGTMIEQQQAKRPCPRLLKSRLSSEERRSLEIVAKLMNKPISEFYDEDSNDTSGDTETSLEDESPPEEVLNIHSDSLPSSKAHWQPANTWPQGNNVNQLVGPTIGLDGSWGQPFGDIFLGNHTNADLNHWSQGNNQNPAGNYGGELTPYDVITEGTMYRSPNWSHHATSEESWLPVQADGSMVNSGYRNTAPNIQPILDSPDSSQKVNTKDYSSQQNQASPPVQNYSSQQHQTSSPVQNYSSQQLTSSPVHVVASDDIEEDWEDLQPQASSPTSQLVPSIKRRISIRDVADHLTPYQSVLLEKSSPSSVEWVPIDPNGDELLLSKPTRRRPFQDQQLRAETGDTRKLKACVRCRMQKIRCLINTDDPSGICLTCQNVTKQKVHTLSCMRYKLTECTLFRIGKAPGLEFTFRWPVMKLKDISKWADTRIRTIKILSDVCPVPLELSVRKFIPIPQDRLQKSWMDGTTKKFKLTTPYAIVNMNAAKKDLHNYINDYIFVCMDYWLRDRHELIKETFKFAREYMLKAPEDEQALLADYFRLWFASRRTATTESIIGEDTLDMEAETADKSYPLPGTIPLPPVMIQQLDMILTLGFLQPLRKKVLEKFNKLVLKNNPKSWTTIYLITFMSLQSCAAFTSENYDNARKHGLVRRFAMPNFIAERHHSSNVFLLYYHYCTKPCNPFKIDWRKRQTSHFSAMTTNEIDFLLRTSEMVKELKGKFDRVINQCLYEDDFYFVSQMFEEEWSPRDTPIEYGDQTMNGESLRSCGSPKEGCCSPERQESE